MVIPDLTESLAHLPILLGLSSRPARLHAIDDLEVTPVSLGDLPDQPPHLGVFVAWLLLPGRGPRDAVPLNTLEELGHLDRGERSPIGPVLEELIPLCLEDRLGATLREDDRVADDLDVVA